MVPGGACPSPSAPYGVLAGSGAGSGIEADQTPRPGRGGIGATGLSFQGHVRMTALSGSLNGSSSNSALVHALAEVPSDVDLTVWEGLDQLPYFRPDAPGDDQVGALRHAVAAADAVLIATPEYAGGMPGTLKNALDWLVGTGELYAKPVVVLSAAPSPERGHNARRWVEETVRMQGASVVDSYTVAIARSDGPQDLALRAGEALGRAIGALQRGAAISS
ncbi:MAG: NAD(P)H-dependent oxidoreductase [Acidimicrobiia bacterium]|nr:NAD(P)H-dependent oxidoreductase [Acidimicrobiia bacterium]